MKAAASIDTWKGPDDLKCWLAKRFDRLVAAELSTPGAPVDPFQITSPGLSADVIANRFADVRSWAADWQDAKSGEADLDVTFRERQTQRFGRVHIPKVAQFRSVDAAARLLQRTRDLTLARHRYASLIAVDSRVINIVDCWPHFVRMTPADFETLCRFVGEAAKLNLQRMRLREVPCAGMHTKFLEEHRALLGPILAAWNIPANVEAESWPGRLGFVEDDTTMVELRDLDGGLLPYPHLSLPAARVTSDAPVQEASGGHWGVVIAENQATFHALPKTSGLLALFGSGFAVRRLRFARWLARQPLLYLGDLDHAGFQMVAGLRQAGLVHLQTGLMDKATALTYQTYWVHDTSPPGAPQTYNGLTESESAAQQLMAAGPWRLEQERISFNQLVETLGQWHSGLAHRHACATTTRRQNTLEVDGVASNHADLSTAEQTPAVQPC